MSRKVILYIATSLDGMIADIDGGVGFLDVITGNNDVDTRYDDFYQHIGTVVMGSKTYYQVVNELSVDTYPYPGVNTVVLSSKPYVGREGVCFVNEPVEDVIVALKGQSDKDIWIVGGASIITPLMVAGLIDEYHISIIPTILGSGIPLYQNIAHSLHFEMVDTSLVNGLLTYTYQPRVK